jgi:hypothetical protein
MLILHQYVRGSNGIPKLVVHKGPFTLGKYQPLLNWWSTNFSSHQFTFDRLISRTNTQFRGNFFIVVVVCPLKLVGGGHFVQF